MSRAGVRKSRASSACEKDDSSGGRSSELTQFLDQCPKCGAKPPSVIRRYDAFPPCMVEGSFLMPNCREMGGPGRSHSAFHQRRRPETLPHRDGDGLLPPNQHDKYGWMYNQYLIDEARSAEADLRPGRFDRIEPLPHPRIPQKVLLQYGSAAAGDHIHYSSGMPAEE
jgi:hypothetical protein